MQPIERRILTILLALTLMIGGVSSTWADDRQQNIVKGSKIIGKNVQTMAGKNIGEIKDLAIDEFDGQIRYAVLSFGGILGLGEKYFAIPWEALQLSEDRTHFALPVTEKELEKAPGFDKHNWPDFADPVYYATIYEFYQIPLPTVGADSTRKFKSPTTKPNKRSDAAKDK